MVRIPGPRQHWLRKTLSILCPVLLCILYFGKKPAPLNLVGEEALWDSVFSQDAAVEVIPQILATHSNSRYPRLAPCDLLLPLALSLMIVSSFSLLLMMEAFSLPLNLPWVL